MATHKSRAGSLQYWPRKRASKVLPSVNWRPVSKLGRAGLQGFIGYKVGMASLCVKDITSDSMTKNKRIIIPATILECPNMKIYSVRFYKNNNVIKDIVVGFDNFLKRVLKKPKEMKKVDDMKEDYDDIRLIVYSDVKKTGIKKKPDIIEIALGGAKEDKLKFVKENINKEFSVNDIFSDGLVDVHGVTKGYGTQGPVKRFGIKLKSYKSEKGRRRPGNVGPWHPARVTFRVPMAGQTGYFSRTAYNNLIISVGKTQEKDINKDSGFKHYGKIKTNYIILKGSVQGPVKRPLLITNPLRPTRSRLKQKYELMEIR